jgi:hypothetical protein
MIKKIAFAKVGWSEHYEGGPVLGRHADIKKYNDAHELFNFLQGPSLRYYGFIPPTSKYQRPPQPKDPSNWLVIFVAARNGNGPLTVVGWYENASFEAEYVKRPEYKEGVDFETDVNGTSYVYCISSDHVVLIPPNDRNIEISGDRFRRASLVYARGNGSEENWREELAVSAERILKTYHDNKNNKITPPDSVHRKAVETAAIEAVKDFLRHQQGYRITDRQKDNCGYDLLAKREQQPIELHVEVKGTNSSVPRFFISRTEKAYMYNPRWRLAIVTNALDNPVVSVLTVNQVEKKFVFNPLSWEAVEK